MSIERIKSGMETLEQKCDNVIEKLQDIDPSQWAGLSPVQYQVIADEVSKVESAYNALLKTIDNSVLRSKTKQLTSAALENCADKKVETVMPYPIKDYGIVEIPTSFSQELIKLVVLECIETIGTFEDCWTHEEQMVELKKHFGVK